VSFGSVRNNSKKKTFCGSQIPWYTHKNFQQKTTFSRPPSSKCFVQHTCFGCKDHSLPKKSQLLVCSLKKLDNHFYSATSSFCIRILSSDICLLYDIRLLVPWSGHSKVFIKQFDFSIISTFHKSHFWRKSWKRLCIL
jgi:hypothetical protein